MPSERILQARRERRVEERNQIKQERKNKYDNLDILIDPNQIIKAFFRSKQGVAWKPSIQKYELNLFRNTLTIIKRVLEQDQTPLSFHNFSISERGKLRHIQSVNIMERVEQHVLCDEILVPYLSTSLVYDNCASLKNKGTSFAIERLKVHLLQHYRKYGLEGYVLLIDFSKFFKSISHAVLKEQLDMLFETPEIKTAIFRVIDSFPEGLGLGSQLSQILAIYNLNRIDHYIKEVLRVQGYGRYMDDSYLIFRTKEECYKALLDLEPRYAEMGISINKKKTTVVPIASEFKFLKKKFKLTETGKIIIHIDKSTAKRTKKKLRKLRELYDAGEVKDEDIICSYRSCVGYMQDYATKRFLNMLDNYFKNLFPEIRLETLP